MKAAFLDFATLGDAGLDASPLLDVLPELTLYGSTAADETAERIRDAEFVIVNKCKLDSSILAEARSLRYIGIAATGADNVDLDYARDHGIAVSNIRAYCTQSVVEHVFGVLFALTHSLHRYRQSVRDGHWQTAGTFALLDHPIRELSSMTLGIVGFGELGSAVARMAARFGMQVVVSRRPGSEADTREGRVDFERLLKISDVVSLHCPLTEATQGLFSDDAFRLMRTDSILINTARGGLVDPTALVKALETGEIGAAAIDVLSEEPPVRGGALLDYREDNLILTPHIAWATREARQKAIVELALNVASFQEGRPRCRLD